MQPRKNTKEKRGRAIRPIKSDTKQSLVKLLKHSATENKLIMNWKVFKQEREISIPIYEN